MTGTETGTLTRREQQKAERRRQLLDAGARLIADRGFLGMRLDDLGAAVGISGPAVYRHFPNKEALLVELLVGVSRRLFEGGEAVVADAASPGGALAGLVDFHLDFALGEPELIRIQDRDLDNVPSPRAAKCAGSSAATSRSGWACSANCTPDWPRTRRGSRPTPRSV